MLRFTESTSEADLCQAIVECGQIYYERRLVTASEGNISVRVGHNQILITPSGLCKGRMEAGDLLLMELEGNILSANEGCKPSSETPMHLEAFRQRPDIRAVLHAHPVFATTLTALERIEHVAEVFWRAKMLEQVNRIPGSEVEKLLEIKERFSGSI